MSWFVYIAEARTQRFYVGIATNPAERIKEHNSGVGSRFAINQGPFRLAYVSPPFTDKSVARLREVQIKKWNREKREKKGKLIRGEWT